MMKTSLLFILLALTLSLNAFAQVMTVDAGTHFNLENDARLVLSNISFSNSGNIEGTDGKVVIQADSTVLFETEEALELSGLSAENSGDSVLLAGSFDLNVLSISAEHTVILLDTSAVTINSSFSNDGSLSMYSGASFWLKAAVPQLTNQEVTVYRKTTFDSNTGKYSMVGTPVDSSNFSVLGTNAQSWIFEYDESIPHDVTGGDRFIAPALDTLTPGKGYFSAFTGDEEGTVVFQGLPNYKNTTIAVTLTDNVDDPSSVEGFNLLSNPYTCPISFTDFVSVNMSLLDEGSIWIWDDVASDAGGGDGTEDYIVINSLGNTSSRGTGLSKWDGTINVAQGFFVKVNGNGSIAFNQSMKTHEGNDDGSFYRKATYTPETYLLGIKDANETVGKNTLIGFHPEATNGLDKQYDASQFSSSFGVYSLLGDKEMAIQGLSTTWLDNEQSLLPLGYFASDKGEHTISLIHAEFVSGNPVYLNDHELGESVDITATSYTFRSEAGEFNGRFSLSNEPQLVNGNSELTNLSNHVNILTVDHSIQIESDVEGQVDIWSLGGQLLHSTDMHSGQQSFQVMSQGIYVVRMTALNTQGTYKVAVGFDQ